MNSAITSWKQARDYTPMILPSALLSSPNLVWGTPYRRGGLIDSEENRVTKVYHLIENV